MPTDNPHKAELHSLDSVLVHGSNIEAKESQAGTQSTYGDERSQELISQIRSRYDDWKEANLELRGPFRTRDDSDHEVIESRVKLLNDYKDFVDQAVYAEHFDSRSRLHSTVIEEFFVYLFGDLVAGFSPSARVGKSDAFVDIFFSPQSYGDMIARPGAKIEKKDQDFMIGVDIQAELQSTSDESQAENHSFGLPAVVIECKTYVDKTMLGEISRSAESIRSRNPHALYLVASEWIKLTKNYNAGKFNMDQVYIMRKQKNTDRKDRLKDNYEKNPIFTDVVQKIYERVHSHITNDWKEVSRLALSTGCLMPEH